MKANIAVSKYTIDLAQMLWELRKENCFTLL